MEPYGALPKAATSQKEACQEAGAGTTGLREPPCNSRITNERSIGGLKAAELLTSEHGTRWVLRAPRKARASGVKQPQQ